MDPLLKMQQVLEPKLLAGVKHPERVQAVAKVMCHSHFGYHRVALINNSLVLLDHKPDRQNEADWQDLGGRKSRCSATFDCFKNMQLKGVPSGLHKQLKAAKSTRYQRKWARVEKLRDDSKEKMGGDRFSRMRYYVRMLLKHRCNYESIKKADRLKLDIFAVRSKDDGRGIPNVWGSARRLHDHETSPNSARRHPMVVDLSLGVTKGWRQRTNRIAMTVVEGHLVLEIHGRTNDKFPTFTAQVLVEQRQNVMGSIATADRPKIEPHYEWRFEKKWTTIQFRNGFWYLGELSDTCYGKWRPRREIPTSNGLIRAKTS